MSLQSLLTSLGAFLRSERLVNESDPNPAVQQILQSERDTALVALAGQIEEFEALRAASRPFGRIIVAVDDSRQATWALDAAVRLAAEMSARLTLVHVVDVASRLTPEMSLAGVGRDSILESGKCFVQEVGMRLPEGTTADLVVRDGQSADEIVAAAEECGANLIVMGTHGRGRLGTFLLGSTAEAVVRRAHCPVLTVAHDPLAAAKSAVQGAGAEAGARTPATAIVGERVLVDA